jgi:DNA helicase-2/ATP-dependent DNA helicase PcrA
VVSGPAGSGKTSVALQRIAYLLFRDRARLSADQVVFISPSPLFSRYVAAVLPELGEDNPRTLTFDDLLSRVLGPTPFESSAEHYDRVLEKPPGASQSAHLRWRASPAFTALLDTRLQGLSRDGMRFRDLGPGAETWVSRGTFRRWWREGDWRAPIDARLHTLRERARSAVRGRGYGGEDEGPRTHLAGQVLADLDRFDFVDWAGMLADWAADVEAPEAETHGALRLEDAVAVAYLRVRVLEPTDLFNARLVVVDEAQDYTPTHFALLRRLFRAADFTLVGDLHQAGDPYLRLEAWEDAVEALRPAHESHRCGAFVLPLWKTYRSAPAVMEYAARLLPPEVGQQIQVMRLGRGDEPPTLVEVASEELGPALIDILHRERAAGTRTLLVVARTAFEAGRLWAKLEQHVPVSLLTDPEREYQGGYVVMPLYLAKGFEFQTVVIGNASHDRFSDPADARWLYIAMTRSLERVFIVSAGPPSGLLRSP